MKFLSGYPQKINVWASHADEVSRIPEGFTCLAHSSVCSAEAIALPDEHIYGVQWHPEVSHTFEGKRVFENFNRITRKIRNHCRGILRISKIREIHLIPDKP